MARPAVDALSYERRDLDGVGHGDIGGALERIPQASLQSIIGERPHDAHALGCGEHVVDRDDRGAVGARAAQGLARVGVAVCHHRPKGIGRQRRLAAQTEGRFPERTEDPAPGRLHDVPALEVVVAAVLRGAAALQVPRSAAPWRRDLE